MVLKFSVWFAVTWLTVFAVARYSHGDEFEDFHFERIADGVELGVKVPGSTKIDGKWTWKNLDPSDPLIVEACLRNSGGERVAVPASFVKTQDGADAALIQGIQLDLRYAPFAPRNPDRRYPLRGGFRPARRRIEESFAPVASEAVFLNPMETRRVLHVELRNWFDAGDAGFYQFGLKWNAKDLALDKPREPQSRKTYGFNIGTPPAVPTVAELNRDIPVFGDPKAEERLSQIIHDTIALPASPDAVGDKSSHPLLKWSEPAEGLVGRIEYVGHREYAGFVVLLRIRNVSDRTLKVRTRDARPFVELQARMGSQGWSDVPWAVRETRVQSTVALKPGEDCLCYLSGRDGQTISEGEPSLLDRAAEIRIRVRSDRLVEGSRASSWLETPPYPSYPSESQIAELARRVPAPTYLPVLSSLYLSNTEGNFSGSESDVELLGAQNQVVLRCLRLYDPQSALISLNRSFDFESDPARKCFIAALAASHGSERAAIYLLDELKKTDGKSVSDVQAALVQGIRYSAPTAGPLVELAKTALADQRYVTELERSAWSRDTIFRISEWARGQARLWDCLERYSDESFEWWIRVLEETDGKVGAIALGDLGDARAAPVLMKYLALRPEESRASSSESDDTPDVRSRLNIDVLDALAKLRSAEVVPELMKYLEYPEVVGALGEIGDPSSQLSIQNLASAGGSLVVDGKAHSPQLDHERHFAATLALARFASSEEVVELGKMLDDATWDDHERVMVIYRMSDLPDPRAIPFLMRAIKADKSGANVEYAVAAMGRIRSKESVEALLSCFDLDVDNREPSKSLGTKLSIELAIAASLREITGVSLGADKQEWSKWWRANQAKFSLE